MSLPAVKGLHARGNCSIYIYIYIKRSWLCANKSAVYWVAQAAKRPLAVAFRL